MSDAQEVGEESDEDDVLEESVEDEGLLWGSGVLSVHANVNNWLLVEGKVVDNSPNSGEGEGNDVEDASVWELSSALHLVLGEEDNEEAGGKNVWNVEDQKDGWVPPVDVLVKEQEEVADNEEHGKNKGEDTDGDNTALDWEASQAGGVLGFGVGADAKAAAA